MSGMIDNYDELDKRLEDKIDEFVSDIDNGYEHAGFEIEYNINSEYSCMELREEGGKIIWIESQTGIDGTESRGSCVICTKEELLNKSNMDIIRMINSARYYNMMEVEEEV